MAEWWSGRGRGDSEAFGYFFGLAGTLAVIWWLWTVVVDAWDASVRAGWLP